MILLISVMAGNKAAAGKNLPEGRGVRALQRRGEARTPGPSTDRASTSTFLYLPAPEVRAEETIATSSQGPMVGRTKMTSPSPCLATGREESRKTIPSGK